MTRRSAKPSSSDAPADRPVRTCVGCRQRASSSELLRIVASDGRAVVDERRRLPGRGAWLHPDPDCLAGAIRRRAFPRALRVSGDLDVDGLSVGPSGSQAQGQARPDAVHAETPGKQVDPS